ncbi:MAG: DUF1592 domain-containing protein [Pirellulaceae bacterium]
MTIASCYPFVVAFLLLSGNTWATEPAYLSKFLGSHCLECHQGQSAEANLDLAKLSTDITDQDNFDSWVRVFDRVDIGEMPPKDAAQLTHDDRSHFIHWTRAWLTNHQRELQGSLGRVRGRRLTNLQLERSLQDLLGIDIPLATEMPDEPKTGSFSTLAANQSISHFQMEQHLKVVDLALDEAFRRGLAAGDESHKYLTAEQLSRTRTRTREPEFIDEHAVVWSSGLSFYGRIPATTASENGWYRFKFRVASLNEPREKGVWCTVRSGACVSSAPLMSWVDAFEATSEPKDVTVLAWLPKGHMLEIRPGDRTLKQAKFQGGQSANGEGGAQHVPGLKIQWMEVERIHTQSDNEVRGRLFGSLHVNFARNRNEPRIEVEDPQQAAARLLAQFAERAFRRPLAIDSELLEPFRQIFNDSFAADGDFISALRAGYRAILCSARFLYFHEQPGQLDDFAIAARLSYLLWNSIPDAELLQLATAGKLHEPSQIIAQVDRMLALPAGRNFIPDFSAQWLELSEIDFTEPDRKLYPDFDMIVQYAMLAETHAYLQTMLDENASVTGFVKSDHTYLNSRLARYYGIVGVQGDQLQRVKLQPDSHRGGLLAQGAILKVTANGTNTSPVLRGVWVSDRILGVPIPPPPQGVPAIEPDIRGAKTIREQLEKHKSDEQCASCHSKIDPPGFALESFDPTGKWREYYPSTGKGNKHALRVDPSFVTAGGDAFSDFEEFCELKAHNPLPLACNLAEKLLVYGTGADISFVDRTELGKIMQTTAKENYGMRSILHAVVTSQIFLNK